MEFGKKRNDYNEYGGSAALYGLNVLREGARKSKPNPYIIGEEIASKFNEEFLGDIKIQSLPKPVIEMGTYLCLLAMPKEDLVEDAEDITFQPMEIVFAVLVGCELLINMNIGNRVSAQKSINELVHLTREHNMLSEWANLFFDGVADFFQTIMTNRTENIFQTNAVEA